MKLILETFKASLFAISHSLNSLRLHLVFYQDCLLQNKYLYHLQIERIQTDLKYLVDH